MGTSTIRHVTALVVVAALGLGACGGDSHKNVSAASNSPHSAVSTGSSAAPPNTTTTIDTTTTTTPMAAAPAAPGASSGAVATVVPTPGPSQTAPADTAPPDTAPTPPPTTSAPTTTTAPPPPPPAPGAISIKAFTFSPNPLHVGVGAAVTTTNDETGVSHTWTSNTGAWDSGTLAPGASYTFSFSSPGTYEYHCSIHASMTGSVVVS